MKPEPVPLVGTVRAEKPIGVRFGECSNVLVPSSTGSAADWEASKEAATGPPSPLHSCSPTAVGYIPAQPDVCSDRKLDASTVAEPAHGCAIAADGAKAAKANNAPVPATMPTSPLGVRIRAPLAMCREASHPILTEIHHELTKLSS